MVRFFAPVAIWSNLAKIAKPGEEPIKPPEKIARYFDMFDMEKKPFINDEFLPVMANASNCKNVYAIIIF